MKLAIRAAREKAAHTRIEAAVQALIDQGLVSPFKDVKVTVRTNDPQVVELLRLEKIADVLESVVGHVPATLEQAKGYLSQAEILAIPGLTKTSQEAIRAHFAALAEAAALVNGEEA